MTPLKTKQNKTDVKSGDFAESLRYSRLLVSHIEGVVPTESPDTTPSAREQPKNYLQRMPCAVVTAIAECLDPKDFCNLRASSRVIRMLCCCYSKLFWGFTFQTISCTMITICGIIARLSSSPSGIPWRIKLSRTTWHVLRKTSRVNFSAAILWRPWTWGDVPSTRATVTTWPWPTRAGEIYKALFT